MRPSTWRAAVCLLACSAPTGAAQAELVINEVLYDPEGVDADREFVEIANTGSYAATLEGLTLERGDGARDDDWEVVWRGAGERWIAPGGFYRIGLTGPGAGEPAELGLQNGPDAVRLRKLGFELDRVGWGEHERAEYFEGRPAPAVRSGQSLARRQDGIDTDENATDFAASAPTPGRPNSPSVDWSVDLLTPTPELPRPGSRLRLPVLVRNLGREAGDPPFGELQGAGPPLRIGWSERIEAGAAALRSIDLETPADTGRMTLVVRLQGQDLVPENDRDSLRVRVGRGPIRLTEVLAAPHEEDSEWLELRLDHPAGTLVSGLLVEVRGRTIRLGDRRVEEAARAAIVVEDSTAMRRRFPDLPEELFWPYEGSWPRLANHPRGRGAADTIRVRDARGEVIEIAMPGPAPAPGVSLERIDETIDESPLSWAPCAEPAGSTPGRDARRAALRPPEGRAVLTGSPRVVRPGERAGRLEGEVGSEPGSVSLVIANLRGETVRRLLEELWVVGRVAASWDGTDDGGRPLAPGIYIAILEIRRGRESVERQRLALAVAPREAR